MNLGGDGRSLFLPLHPTPCARNLKRLLRNRLHSCGGVCVYVCGIYMSQPIPYSHRFPYAALTHAHKTVLLLTLHCFRALFCLLPPPLSFCSGLHYHIDRRVRPTCPRLRERERERARIERLGERERENGARSDPWEGFFSFSVSIIGSQEWKSIRKRRRTVSNAVRGVYSVSLKSHEKGRGKPGVGLVGTTREGGKVRNLF